MPHGGRTEFGMTHREIAKLANVSVSTVSKALSDSREISNETAEKIKRIALEMGYFKEKSKRKIEYKKGKNPVIAVLCPEIISIAYSIMVTHIKEYAEQRGGRVSVYIYDFSNDKISHGIDSIVLSDEADGIVVIGGKVGDMPDLPMVYLGETDDVRFDSVFHDNDAVMDTAVEHLMRLGHKKIGHVGETLTLGQLTEFRETLEKYGLPFHRDWCYIINKRFEEIGYEAAEKFAAQKDCPTALVCAYDEVALAMIYRLGKLGISVPEDVSVIGKNDIPFAAYSAKPLTTIRMDYEKQCRTCIDLLFDRIYGDDGPARNIKIEHKLVIRETTAEYKEKKNAKN